MYVYMFAFAKSGSIVRCMPTAHSLAQDTGDTCFYCTHKMCNRHRVYKSSLVEKESDMKRNEFETLALLHDAGASAQLQEQIKRGSRDFKTIF